MPFFILHQKFLETAGRFPRKTALQIKESRTEYKKYSYAEALAVSKALGFYFVRQGIKRQDRVAIILENGPQWPFFYFGILFAGATAVPIDPQLTEQEIKNILADSGARLTISSKNANEILKGLKDPPQDFNFPAVDAGDSASILYTSGTTAQPKGVELTHRNFSGNFNSLDKLKICSENDNILSILPLHHSYAFMVTLLLPLFLGGTVTYVKTLKPDEVLSAMRDTGITVMVGVPQIFYLFYKGICEKIAALPLPLRLLRPLISKKVREGFGTRLRFFASGGARLDPKVAEALSGFGFTILEGYGLTETSPVAAFNPLRRQKFGSVGIAIPDVQIRIFNPDKDGTGEVLIKGPNVMKGYYNKQKETDDVIREGWFHSGDLGYIDRDGYLFITGRAKEMIVLSSGKNIYPDEIEDHYQKSRFIKELCVLGVLREGSTEGLGAVIVPDSEYFKSAGEVNVREKIKWDLENFSKTIAAYKRIMSFIIVKEDLPRTRLGKIKRYEVERIYREQFKNQGQGMKFAPQISRVKEPGEKDLEILNSDVVKKITEFLQKERNLKRPIRADDHLELDLGIDSLGRAELAVKLEKQFNIDIPDSDMARIFTVGDAISRISELVAKTQRERPPDIVSGGTMWSDVLRQEPGEEVKSKINLTPGLLDKIIVFTWVKFLYAVFKLIFRLRITGRENVPKQGPFILCPNHSSYLDAFIVAASVPFDCEMNLFFLGFREYFMQPVIKNLVKVMRVIPVDPAQELVNAMQASGFAVRNKKSLCIFPEGQRSIDGRVKEFKKGIGIIAGELGVTLIPVYIDGAFDAWPRAEKFPRPSSIRIIFGRPFDVTYLLQTGRAKGSKDDYEAIAVGVREEVVKLKGQGWVEG